VRSGLRLRLTGVDEERERPRAVVVLEREGHEVLLGPVYGEGRCDLGFVDDLLRVQLAARRFGWSIRLREVRPDLLELVELVGLRTELLSPARSAATRR
jgi:hypothetical protein